jgi:hypothetical protein
MKKNKKIILSSATVLTLVLNLFFPVLAQAYSFPINVGPYSGSAEVPASTISQMTTDITKKATSDIESRYGLDKDVWKRAQRKEFAPRVDISFDNTNPKAGEKVTANAIPEFFKNDPQNLYFTWYIIHTSDGTIQGATNKMDEGKIEASKIMTRGDYDSGLDEARYNSSNADPDSDGWPAIDDSYDENKSSAPMGGADGTGGLEEGSANIEQYSTAGGYCDAKGGHSLSSCDVYTNKSSFNQYYNLKSSQSGDYCAYCQENTTFTATLSSNNQCCYLVAHPEDPAYDSYDSAINYCPSSYSAAYESCFDYSTLQSTNSTLITNCLDTQYAACETEWGNTHDNNNAEEGSTSSDFTRCYRHNFGVNAGAVGFRGYEGDTNSYGSDGSGLDNRIACTHKWKNAKSPTCTANDCKSGSGKFPTGEEKYWGSDPNDPDTDGDGFSDEADVIGLGQESFTWNYAEGDRVGVVVEGTSMIPTDEKNAYYKIMWGYMDTCDSTKTKLMDNDECDGSGDYGFGFLATKSPSEESSEEKLQVSLSYSPDSPIADPTSDETISDADEITVTSSLDNTDLKPESLYYTWYIQQEDSSVDSGWKNIDLADNVDLSTNSSGLGVSTFSFTPKKDFLKNKSADLVNLKVVAAVSRTSEPTTYEKDTLSRTTPRKGFASVEVPINKNGVSIKLYKVGISKDGKAILGDEICDNKSPYKTYCPAVQNQMMAAKISTGKYTSGNSQFSWSLDGDLLYQPLDYTVFEDWNSTTDTTVFFPITKSAKETEKISVTATPKDKLQAVTASRSIAVIDPVVYIKSSDESLSWPKEYTVESKTTKDDSYSVKSNYAYEALTDSVVSFSLNSIPNYLLSNDENIAIDWSINGTSIQEPGFSEEDEDLSLQEITGNNISFATSMTEGVYYTLGADFKKYWSQEERDILYSAWGVQPSTLESNSSLDIETIAEVIEADTSTMANPKQILAAIGTHLPEYAMYILRLTLTLLVMFFSSVFFYGLTQRISLYEKK